jgi:dipeptidyl-peptidase-4
VSEISFPRQYARTRRFSLGTPRSFVVAPDGQRILFLRSRSGSDALTCLYCYDVATQAERLVVDPESLLSGGLEELPAEERARRERARESSGGIVRFHTDTAATRAVFDLSGHVYVVDVASRAVQQLAVASPAVDPRLSPSGAHVAYVSNGVLRVIGVGGTSASGSAEPASADRIVAGHDSATGGGAGAGLDFDATGDPHANVSYGLAEFVAAEEMDRSDGYWWAPDSSRLLVARVDVSEVQRRYIADPAEPTSAPMEVAYPAAGTPNAEVRLLIVPVDGSAQPVVVGWDRGRFEYVTTAAWSEHGLLVVVQSRDQRCMQVLAVDPATGASAVVREDRDDCWVDIVGGVPAHLSDGTFVWTADVGDAKRLVIGEETVTPDELQVRSVLGVDGDVVLLSGSIEPSEIGVWSWSPSVGLTRLAGADEPVVATACRAGGTTVLAARCLDRPGLAVSVLRDGQVLGHIESLAETPVITAHPRLLRAGTREIRTAVLFPEGHVPGSKRLPVLLDPYGGPHAQMVLAASGVFLTSQWFANQGYCVIVADGRGTPGRGPAWDRTLFSELAAPVLEDQIAALHAVAEEEGDLDLSRVAIRGWSFGGYLAALAVLRRPDVFHAAVAGAPPTEWRLYDTHYTERYLGDPNTSPENYDRTSLLREAAELRRPLLLIHGLADDNVTAANTLQLSAALLAAGRQHCVLPLSGVTHMTPQEVVAENLLLFQVDFLRAALDAPAELAS